MEVFKVFATFSLVDMLSGPLGRMQGLMRDMDATTSGLGQKMGNLALAMGPVALGAGAILGAFGSCVSTAAGFEDQMAKVGAISRASAADMQTLEAKARELGATTQFTSVQVGEAEQFLAMAGFNVKDNIDALPGVLNLAAATATDLGRAADISSDILGAFGMKANEMGRVADVLAATCSTANTNMELLGDTMKYVAPVAQTAGLSIEETAAMAGLLGNVGIKGSQAGTTLKAMLNKMAAPAKDAQAVFAKLGITVKDQAGNLRSPIQVLGEMSKKLAKMGTAEQMAAMKAVVGEEAVAGFSELIKKGGIGEIEKYIAVLQKSGGVCDEMAAKMNDTLGGDVRSLGSAFESAKITIGKIFIPILRKGTSGLTSLVRWFDALAQNPAGKFIVKFAAGLATAVVAVTGFAAAFWALSRAGGAVMGIFAPIKAAILGLGAPVLALIAAAGLFYAAWKTNFGGIADVLSKWGRNISLVFKGVTAIFDNLKGSSSEIRGELAREIKAAGLEKVVVNIGKMIYRIREFFAGIWDGLNLDGVTTILAPVILKLRDAFEKCASVIGSFFGASLTSASGEVRSLGAIVGGVLTVALEGLAVIVATIARGFDSLVSFARMVCAIFTGDWATAAQEAGNIWQNFCDSLMSFADYFRIGDWVRQAWADVTNWLSTLNLFESGMRLINTFKDGVIAAASGLVEGVKSVFQKVRNLMPFSDAREGPLSTLTLSGQRLMTTIGEGVALGGPALREAVSSNLQDVKSGIEQTWQGLSGTEIAAPKMEQPLPVMPEIAMPETVPVPLPEPLAAIKEQGISGSLGKTLLGGLDFIKEKAGGIASSLGNFFDGLWDNPAPALSVPAPTVLWDNPTPALAVPDPAVPEPPGAPQDVAQARENMARQDGDKYFTLHIANITLPNVKDANDLFAQLESVAAEYGESMA